jgi:GNAT superfamily N-acetyltransferase
MNAQTTEPVSFRETVTKEDREEVRRIVHSSGFFSEHEIAVAVELVDERLAKGLASGYFFIFAMLEGKTIGYSCFGPIACTVSSFDLFWIAVDTVERGRRIGTLLLQKSEEAIKIMGGSRIYVETSSRPLYETTRMFYEKRAYRKEAVLENFYGMNDAKVIYVKVV